MITNKVLCLFLIDLKTKYYIVAQLVHKVAQHLYYILWGEPWVDRGNVPANWTLSIQDFSGKWLYGLCPIEP